MNESNITPAVARTRLTRYIGEVCNEMGLDAEFREFYFTMCDRCLIDIEKLERAAKSEIEISVRHLADLKRDYVNDCITISNLPGVKLGVYQVMDLAREVSHIEREVVTRCVRDTTDYVDPLVDECGECEENACDGCYTFEDDCNA